MKLLLHELLEAIFTRALHAEGFPARDRAIRQAADYIVRHFAKPITRAEAAQLPFKTLHCLAAEQGFLRGLSKEVVIWL